MARDIQPARVTSYSGWDSVRLAVDSVFSSQLERFEPNTVANVLDVLSACERRTKIPDGVKKGYWTTVVLWWDKFELEVFGETEWRCIDSTTKARIFGMRSICLENHSRRDPWLN
jgi:hypothetical protein